MNIVIDIEIKLDDAIIGLLAGAKLEEEARHSEDEGVSTREFCFEELEGAA